jgi:hypothetical protein
MYRINWRAVPAVAAIGAIALGAAASAAGDSLRTLTDGSWSYFGDPRAVRAHGTTFLGWVTSDGHVQVGSLKGKDFQRRTLDFMGRDDHNNPSLYVRRDGRIVAFYTSHSGSDIPASRRHRMFYRISLHPHDITSWGSIHSFASNTAPVPGNGDRGFTYPNPQRVGDRVWLFWRGGSWWPTLSTTKDFSHWTKPINVVSSINGQRPYVKYAGDGSNVYMAFTRAHPEAMDTGIYFLRISENGTVHRADGTQVGTLSHPVPYTSADVVYRFGPNSGRAWVMDVAIDTDGHPVVLYFRRQKKGGDTYRYAVWNGTEWRDRPIVAAGRPQSYLPAFYQGGATLDHEDPSVVYLSRRPGSGSYEVELWTTPDHGRNWTSKPITRHSSSNNWRPVSPLGFTGYQVFFWNGRYIGFRDYNTNVVVGMKRAARRAAR